jgi:hypothetical protein
MNNFTTDDSLTIRQYLLGESLKHIFIRLVFILLIIMMIWCGLIFILIIFIQYRKRKQRENSLLGDQNELSCNSNKIQTVIETMSKRALLVKCHSDYSSDNGLHFNETNPTVKNCFNNTEKPISFSRWTGKDVRNLIIYPPMKI